MDPDTALPTVRELVREVEAGFANAALFYGHGTDNATDEAVYLVLGALGVPFDADDAALDESPAPAAVSRVRRLAERRISERIPVAYLLHEAWFAGLPFFVDERVLIPRSPIAELIEERFSPWLDESQVKNILDVGTGSGCIAVACALAFPEAHVDAIDNSRAALDVAAVNIDRYELGDRVRGHESDLFEAVRSCRYDLIVANPPYVPQTSFDRLPAEYRHEPRAGLLAGADGLDIVRRLLAGAAEHLTGNGLLVVEVGEARAPLMQAFPDAPFMWIEFEHGGEGVFQIGVADLQENAALFDRT